LKVNPRLIDLSSPLNENKPMVTTRNTALIERLVFAIGGEYGAKAKIARACNIEPQSITNWIKRGTIDHAHLPKISEVTGVNLEWLMTGKGEPFGGAEPDSEKKRKAISKIAQLDENDLILAMNFIDSIIAARSAIKQDK
jgi:transcriptional regulator with XRE-family HTH domain